MLPKLKNNNNNKTNDRTLFFLPEWQKEMML